MASSHSTADAHGHGALNRGRLPGSEHINHPNPGILTVIYFALLGLLVVTVGLYSVDLQKVIKFVPGINLIVALIVAVIKAALVVWFFMNVRGGTRLIALWAFLGFIWLLFMGGIFMDYLTRHWVDQAGWQAIQRR
ncbi:MAG: cytochrome C oxidase subunit IV family protein [Capsulimonadales bacterium]|nr:cytochrome C oxidase subunit IV family protein [Capsulimonadales bacterium]